MLISATLYMAAHLHGLFGDDAAGEKEEREEVREGIKVEFRGNWLLNYGATATAAQSGSFDQNGPLISCSKLLSAGNPDPPMKPSVNALSLSL